MAHFGSFESTQYLRNFCISSNVIECNLNVIERKLNVIERYGFLSTDFHG